MANLDIPTASPSSPAATEPAATQAALAALVHRLNGGLNNAVMAFELLQAHAVDAPTRRILQTGIAGVEQAARASKLIDALLNPSAGAWVVDDRPYLHDIFEILLGQGSRSGCSLHVSVDVPPTEKISCSPGAASASLARGLAAISRAGNDPLELVATTRDGEQTLEVLSAGG